MLIDHLEEQVSAKQSFLGPGVITDFFLVITWPRGPVHVCLKKDWNLWVSVSLALHSGL